jgi:flavin-dependent dehydrogenase
MSLIDVLVVGGGPAGISTALHLHAEAPNLRVVVLEKERYPREKYCAGGVGGRAFATLARIGVRVDVPMVPFTGIDLRRPGDTIHMRDPRFGAVVRRIEFDHALAKVAMSRGIDVREGAAVRGVEPRGDGVRVTLATGETLEARVLVGADGVGGATRRGIGFDGGTLRAQVIECDTEPVAGDPGRDTLVFDTTDRTLGGYGWDFPTLVNGEEKVCRGIYVIRTLGQENVHERLRAFLAARGLDMANYKLKPFGERGFDPAAPVAVPRVILVGEAAGIDIATGEGIAQAIDYGAIAAPYLARALSRGDLGFEDWKRVIGRSRLGINLFFRTLMYRTFYAERARTERLFERNHAVLDLFAQEFAGSPYRLGSLLSAATHTPLREIPWLLGVARGIVRDARS